MHITYFGLSKGLISVGLALAKGWGGRARCMEMGGGSRLGGLLASQFLVESLLALGDVGLVASGIDEGVVIACLPFWVLGGEAEVGAVGAEEDVAGKSVEDGEAALVIRGDAGIGLVADQLVAGIDVGAADDYDVEGTCIGLVGRRFVEG